MDRFSGLDFNLVYNPSNYSCELLTLPQSGTYVAQITSSPPQPEFFTTGNEPGTADVQIFDGTPINDSISFDGPPVSISSNPGQPVDLNFSGTAGQYGMLTISGSGYTGAVVLNPDGSYLSGDPIINGQITLGCPVFRPAAHTPLNCSRIRPQGVRLFNFQSSPGKLHYVDRRIARACYAAGAGSGCQYHLQR